MRAYWTRAAEGFKNHGKAGWIHFAPGIKVPPTFDGSYNYLLWHILQKRYRDDLVICDYDSESFTNAQEQQLAVIQIETQPRIGRLKGRISSSSWLLNSLLARLESRTESAARKIKDKQYFELVHSSIRTIGASRILIWGENSVASRIRELFPRTKIAFAQRHYEYSPAQSPYSFCDIVVMQTRGQVNWAFQRHERVTPLVVVIPNGVELDVFMPTQGATRRDLRIERKLEPDKFIVLFPSKLAPHKGTRYLLEWIKSCLATYSQIHFLVVGGIHHSVSQYHRSEIETTLKSAPNVTWLQGISREDMPTTYRLSDVCIMPALWREGFSMASIEAMASGLPVIASEQGCYTEIIRTNFNGILCSQSNLLESGLAAISYLANHQEIAAEMGRNARQYAELRLSRTKVLSNFDAFLEDRWSDIDDSLDFTPLL